MKSPFRLADALNFLKPPVYEDEMLNFLARMSYYIFITAFLFSTYFWFMHLGDESWIGSGFAAFTAITVLISFVLLKNNRFNLAISLTSVVTLLSILSASLFNEGIASITMYALAPIFLLIMTFMRLRMVLFFGAVTIASMGVMIQMERMGYYDTNMPLVPMASPGVLAIVLFIMYLIILYSVVKISIGTSRYLIEARMMAEDHNRIRNDYFANMTHELRTPLNAIIGYSEDIIDISSEDGCDVDSEIVEDVQHIHKAGKYLLSLINDILDISKIEADRMDIFVNQFSARELINEIQSTVHPMVREYGNRLVISGVEPEQKLITDRQKLRQILINLLSNAAKFTEIGEISVEFSIVEDTEYRFVISDTGIGIPEELLPKLFDSYSQSTYTASAFKGTGLGLAITKKLTELLDGELIVESQVNVGTQFTIILPALHEYLHMDEPSTQLEAVS